MSGRGRIAALAALVAAALAVWGWARESREIPPASPPPSPLAEGLGDPAGRRVTRPLAAAPPTPEEAAMREAYGALARAAGRPFASCPVPEGLPAELSASLLRFRQAGGAVEGLLPAEPQGALPVMESGGDGRPVAVLAWSAGGAACAIQPAERALVTGSLVGPGAGPVSLTGCEDPVVTGEGTGFRATAVRGLPCVLFARDEGARAQGSVSVGPDGPYTGLILELDAPILAPLPSDPTADLLALRQRLADEQTEDTPFHRALADPALGPAARAILEAWLEEELDDRFFRLDLLHTLEQREPRERAARPAGR